jgi:hypothetical protein
MKIKIICGYRKEQEYSVSAEEAHKAYYLFLNPEQRGIFSNGLAIVGKDIQRIEPDYHGTMGWNSTYQMVDDDWNEVKRLGLDRKFRDLLSEAKEKAINSPQMLTGGGTKRIGTA